MFFRNHTFSFKGKKHSKTVQTLSGNLEYHVQIIVYGSQGSAFLSEFTPALPFAPEEPLALDYKKSSTVVTELRLDLTSKIKYKVRKNERNAFFTHDDTPTSESSSVYHSAYDIKKCTPDFETKMKTWIVIAPKDNNELLDLLKKIGSKIGSNLKYFCVHYPTHIENNESRWDDSLVKNAFFGTNYVAHVVPNSVKMEFIVDHFKQDLYKDFLRYADAIEKQNVNSGIEQAAHVFLDELDKKAANYFEHKK